MKFPIVDFDSDNNIIDTKDIEQDRYAAFANREVLNKWCGSNFRFQADNGIGTENFYNDIPWCELQGVSPGKYYWGEDVAKKVASKGYTCGASPFAYSEFLYDDSSAERKYKTVFLPKSDYPYKTRFKEDKENRDKIVELVKSLNEENTIFIAFPFDYFLQYVNFLPYEIISKTYVLGYNGFDARWIKRLKKVLMRSECIYTPHIFSTNVAYATYLDIPVKFFNHNFYELGKIPSDQDHKEFHEFTTKKYTVVPDERDSRWNDLMTHLKNCFDNDGPDKYWWVYKFLSLDRIKPPEELYEELKKLHYTFVGLRPEFKNVDLLPFEKSHDFYDILKEKSDRILNMSNGVSQKSLDHLENL